MWFVLAMALAQDADVPPTEPPPSESATEDAPETPPSIPPEVQSDVPQEPTAPLPPEPGTSEPKSPEVGVEPAPAPEPESASDPQPSPPPVPAVPPPPPAPPSEGVALSGALPSDTGPLASLEIVAPGTRKSSDVEVWVRRDGNYYLDDDLLMQSDLGPALSAVLQRSPGVRVIISSDDNAPHGRILAAVRAATDAGVDRIALMVEGVDTIRSEDPLFPGAEGMDGVSLTELNSGLTKAQERKLRPKRWKFPQNPYGQTDFTAYTVEWGETKIGLANLTYGLFPRIQVGTVPSLDIVGVLNANVKANLVREGPFDAAFIGQLYVVPVNELIEEWDRGNDAGLFGTDASGNSVFTTTISVAALGAQTSMQLARPWSIHLGASYLRVEAAGAFDVQNVPEIILPGLQPIGGDFELVPRIIGEMVQARFATDFRFNRRDSLVFQAQAPVFARARAAVSASLADLPEQVENVDVIVAYGQSIPLQAAYRVSLSYQFSWKHVDLRFGVGLSPIPFTWGLNAFDLSYRFGGRTRSNERQIRKGYRQNRRSLRDGADTVPEDGDSETVVPSNSEGP